MAAPVFGAARPGAFGGGNVPFGGGQPAAPQPAAPQPAASQPAATQQAILQMLGMGQNQPKPPPAKPQPLAVTAYNRINVKEYDYIPREKRIKSTTSENIDKYTSGSYRASFLRLMFITPIILSGIYLATTRQDSDNFNLVLTGLILYSIFGGYLLLDIINERYRKYIILLGMTIGSLVLFIVALTKDNKNGLLTTIVTLTAIILFVLIVYNVTLLQFSSTEILDIAPTIGNYIVKLDSIKNAPGYGELPDIEKEQISLDRRRLLENLKKSTKDQADYRDAFSNKSTYKNLQDIFDNIDSNYLGSSKMRGTGGRIPQNIRTLMGASMGIDDYLFNYQTDRSIYKDFMETKKK